MALLIKGFSRSVEKYILFCLKDKKFVFILNKKLFIVTTQIEQAKKRYQVFIEGKKITQPIFTCDATALKTVARSIPTLYLMNGSIVKQKWGLGDFKKVFK